MAVPKRKVTRSRGGMRASHKKLTRKSLSTCKTCDAPKMPHAVCMNCGHYNDKAVLKVHGGDF